MRYVEAKVNGKFARLEVLKETPLLSEGKVEVLVIPPSGVGARRIKVDPEDIKSDPS